MKCWVNPWPWPPKRLKRFERKHFNFIHMNKILLQGLLCMSLFPIGLSSISAQEMVKPAKSFSLADTLRGSLLPERTWWDVQRYEIGLKPDYNSKTIQGSNKIVYNVVKSNDGQIR